MTAVYVIRVRQLPSPAMSARPFLTVQEPDDRRAVGAEYVLLRKLQLAYGVRRPSTFYIHREVQRDSPGDCQGQQDLLCTEMHGGGRRGGVDSTRHTPHTAHRFLNIACTTRSYKNIIKRGGFMFCVMPSDAEIE